MPTSPPGHAAAEFGLRWDRWPSDIWASSMAFSGPVPSAVAVHHANFLIEKAMFVKTDGVKMLVT